MTTKFKDYSEYLNEQFKDLEINLVKHDTSFGGLPCYIEVHLSKAPKDRGQTVLDLGNYIYRTTGLRYQATPEYRGKGKSTTVRWFMSWDDLAHVIDNIFKALGRQKLSENWLPVEFQSLIIQNSGRGVVAKESA